MDVQNAVVVDETGGYVYGTRLNVTCRSGFISAGPGYECVVVGNNQTEWQGSKTCTGQSQIYM